MRRRTSVLMCLPLIAALAATVPARAAFHIMKVREVYAGSPDAPNAQFIELQLAAFGQSQVGGHSVIVYDSANTELGRYTFPASVGNGASNASILVATTQAQSYFGFTTPPDLIMTADIPAAGGKVCFDAIDCVSWGSYPPGTPSGMGSSTGAPLTPLENGTSIDRRFNGTTMTDSGDSASDFLFVAPTPKKNDGTSGSPTVWVGLNAATYTAGASTALVTVARSPSTGSLTVDYSTSDGTAIAGTDYTYSTGTVSFVDGQAESSFSVPITGPAPLNSKSFNVHLRNPSAHAFTRMNATVIIPGQLPSEPQAVVAVGTATQINLDWEAPASSGASPLTEYKIFRSSTSGGEGNTPYASVPAAQTAFSDGTIPAGTTYFYQVAAANSSGTGTKSVEVSATVVDNPPQIAITSPGNNAVIVGGTPAIQGTASDDVGIRSITLFVRNLQNNATVKTLTAVCTPACPGGSAGAGPGAVSWTATLPGAASTLKTSDLPPGSYLVFGRATDVAGKLKDTSLITVIFIS